MMQPARLTLTLNLTLTLMVHAPQSLIPYFIVLSDAAGSPNPNPKPNPNGACAAIPNPLFHYTI